MTPITLQLLSDLFDRLLPGPTWKPWLRCAAVLFGLSALAHPPLHWAWALAALVGCTLLSVPLKVLLAAVFRRMRGTPRNGPGDR